MRHSFYAPDRNTKNAGRGSGGKPLDRGSRFGSSGSKAAGVTETKEKGFMIVEAKVKAALKANEAAPEVRSEILGELSMYRVNISIARECHDKKSEKDLTKNFINYLNQKSNESRGK